MNPYNCTKPGNLFVGYESLRKELMRGFVNGNSYAIVGGRRCGKTSLLMQIENDLNTEGLAPFVPLVFRFSIQEMNELSPSLLFEMIYCRIVHDIQAAPWKNSEGKDYANFLNHIDHAAIELSKKYGQNWLAIILIDELDSAISKLHDDQFFQNLRNLLMESRFAIHFRVVATGVKGMAQLISSGASPLNNLRNKYLSILSDESAHKLVETGFSNFLYHIETLNYLFKITGKHPFILQGLLECLWETKKEWDKKTIKHASRSFLRERTDFQRWLEQFESSEHVVYQILIDSFDSTLTFRDIKNRMDISLKPEADDAIMVLSYHGVVDDSEPDGIKPSGTLFKDWYKDHSVDYSAVQIIKQLRDEVSKLKESNEKMMILGVLDEALKKTDKNSLKSSVEKATSMFKTASDTAGSINLFIEKAEKLGPYLGTAAGWLSRFIF